MVKDARDVPAARGDGYTRDDRWDGGGPPWIFIFVLGACLFAGDAIIDGLIRWGWTAIQWSVGVSMMVALIALWVWVTEQQAREARDDNHDDREDD